jgi:hypothetical protein
MALESYKKEQERLEKEEAKKAGTPEKPKDALTLKEIMNDDKHNALLGEMIERDGSAADKEMFARLVSDKMDTADIDALSKFSGKFAERIRDAESVQEELTPELAREIAENNPDLKKVMGLVGPEGIVSAVRGTIKNIAISDPETFKKISKSVETMKSFREGDLRELDDYVQKKCKKEGINVDEYMKILAITDGVERVKALEVVIKNKWDKNGWGGLKRAVNFLSGDAFSIGEANRLESVKGEINATFAQLDKYKKKVGSVLGASIKGNKDLFEAMSREIVGGPKKKELAGMNEVKAEIPTKESLLGDFKKWKEKTKIAGWDNMNEIEREPYRDAFLRERSEAGKKAIQAKGGFWAMVFGGLFDMMFAGFDKKSLN